MKNMNRLAIAIAAGTLFTLSDTALAQGMLQHAYIGGSVGQSKDKDACNGLPSGVTCNDTDTAWKIFGGYQFNPNFAVEVGYTDLGEAKASGFVSGVNVNASAKAKAWELVGVGSLPLGSQFSLFAKVGGYHGTVDETATGTGGGGSATVSASATNNGWTYGLGARFDINKNLGVRAEWQRYNKMGDESTTGTSDVDVIGIGILWSFR